MRKATNIKSKKTGVKYIIGIDEVGRGPLAGPVTVCAFAINKDLFKSNSQKNFFKKIFNTPDIKDSKALTESRRKSIDVKIREIVDRHVGKVAFSIKSKTAQQIDIHGIATCIRNLVSECLNSIISELSIDPMQCEVRLDGGLKAPSEFVRQKAYIKGDTLFGEIACASILAKVHRDTYMKKISKKYPNYKFDIHKGYGTKAHRDLIMRYGVSTLHRKTFCKNILTKGK